MKVILNHQEVDEAITLWLAARNLKVGSTTPVYRIVNEQVKPNQYEPRLQTTVEVEPIEVKEHPYR